MNTMNIYSDTKNKDGKDKDISLDLNKIDSVVNADPTLSRARNVAALETLINRNSGGCGDVAGVCSSSWRRLWAQPETDATQWFINALQHYKVKPPSKADIATAADWMTQGTEADRLAAWQTAHKGETLTVEAVQIHFRDKRIALERENEAKLKML